MRTAYLAFEDFTEDLKAELQNIVSQWDRLFLCEGPPQNAIWAQDIWPEARQEKIASIGDGVKKLKSAGKLWAHYSVDSHRRAQLIQDQLPIVHNKPLDFMQTLKPRSLGSWSLIAADEILFSARSRSPFALGEVHFNENKETPPSRAYLKLWEFLTLYGPVPAPGERVVDLGSCPGGWTWVLQQVGAHVVSVDKAPLDEKIGALPRIEYIKKDAFKLTPPELRAVDWLFSDIICYPRKLYDYLQAWIPTPTNLVCTIKFQGPTDPGILREFLAIPGSRIVHLFHNKHEVTWIRTHASK